MTTLKRVKDNDNKIWISSFCHLFCIDWDSKKVLFKKEIETTKNESGRSVGLRGLDFYNDSLYVADSAGRLYIFDIENFELKKQLELGNEDVHQLRVGLDNNLWIACARTNTLMQMDTNDKIVCYNIKDIVEKYIEDRQKTRGLYFNSIGWCPNNHQIHIYSNAKAIFDFTDKKIIYQGFPLERPHDIEYLDENTFFVSNSLKRNVIKFLWNKITNKFDLTEFATELTINPQQKQVGKHAILGFTRGLRLSKKENLLFSCCSPKYVRSYNSETLEFAEYMNLGEDLNDTIYDICLDPRDWNR